MDAIRWATLIFSMIGVALWIVFYFIVRELRLHAISPIIWLSNVASFQSYRIYLYPRHDWLTALDLNLWSQIIQLHAVLMFAGLAALAVAYRDDLWLMVKGSEMGHEQ